MRIVFDTNVLFAAFVTYGACAGLYEECLLSGQIADAEVLEPQPLVIPVCRDADDDWILATALAGKADALVTGNKDLLVLERYEGIPILAPRDCLALLRST